MLTKVLIFMLNYFLSVGFFMFMERKILGVGHMREGPNKISLKGIFQFFMDMIKLLMKNLLMLINTFYLIYLIFPLLMFFNMILLWFIIPFIFIFINTKISMIFLIVLLVLKMIIIIVLVYFLYSVYSYLSVIRMIIQVVSYDIVIILVLICFIMVYNNLSLKVFIYDYFNTKFLFNFYLYIFWNLSLMVELIRLPFDFYEGESELISGFNIEFSSFLFVFIVLIEYMEMIYFMFLSVLMFFYGNFNLLLFYFILFILIFVLIWFRVFFVRYRLDKMLMLLWKYIFPLFMFFILFYYFINFF
uniref:NADH-ubiquinone oxidoreductase chain 1 n=1 Tax=Didesmococcus koreanus TaxID=1661411 RepID=A0A891H0E6_9HEMI|nr:NADH dehydrogenase subunit 1 [Didesmococcus koreanus]QRK27462.1 NADH dehydrogenase subunit 1 [Didesmococcus koreanus]